MENVLWKPMKGFEEKYLVSDTGKVKSIISGKILKPSIHYKGYQHLFFYQDGKKLNKYVHRIVLETFYPVANMHELHCDHIDENKVNNHLSNLRWLSPLENLSRSQTPEKIKSAQEKRLETINRKKYSNNQKAA